MASLDRQDIKPKGQKGPSLSFLYTNTFRKKVCTYLYEISFWVKVLFSEKSKLQSNF